MQKICEICDIPETECRCNCCEYCGAYGFSCGPNCPWCNEHGGIKGEDCDCQAGEMTEAQKSILKFFKSDRATPNEDGSLVFFWEGDEMRGFMNHDDWSNAKDGPGRYVFVKEDKF